MRGVGGSFELELDSNLFVCSVLLAYLNFLAKGGPGTCVVGEQDATPHADKRRKLAMVDLLEDFWIEGDLINKRVSHSAAPWLSADVRFASAEGLSATVAMSFRLECTAMMRSGGSTRSNQRIRGTVSD